MRELESMNVGFGVGVKMPPAWASHKWICVGTPDPALTAAMRAAIRGECPLPPSAALHAWPDLEASAARALDLEAPLRLAAIFHADDPSFPSSSRGALQSTCDLMASWSARSKAEFHVAKKKSVIMIAGTAEARAAAASAPPVTLRRTPSGPANILEIVEGHRYLGVLWRPDLQFLPSLSANLHAADSAFQPLAGLVAARAIPLATAALLFESKIDSVLAHGRWLYFSEESRAMTNATFERWAKGLLGGTRWRNGAVATSELGWSLSGEARIVRAVALRRWRILSCDADDVYRRVFDLASTRGGSSWAAQSCSLLRQSALVVEADAAGQLEQYDALKKRVTACLVARDLPRWEATAGQHHGQVQYLLFQKSPSDVLARVRTLDLPWQVQHAVRSWCRLRADYIRLRRYGKCLFCGIPTRYGTTHVLAKCTRWTAPRTIVIQASSDSIAASARLLTHAVLGCAPESEVFPTIVMWAAEIDEEASRMFPT